MHALFSRLLLLTTAFLSLGLGITTLLAHVYFHAGLQAKAGSKLSNEAFRVAAKLNPGNANYAGALALRSGHEQNLEEWIRLDMHNAQAWLRLLRHRVDRSDTQSISESQDQLVHFVASLEPRSSRLGLQLYLSLFPNWERMNQAQQERLLAYKELAKTAKDQFFRFIVAYGFLDDFCQLDNLDKQETKACSYLSHIRPDCLDAPVESTEFRHCRKMGFRW